MNIDHNHDTLIQDALQSVPLPPRAVQELLRISQEADVDMQRIVDTITSDEALTARVMRVVNSALFGLKRRVSSVQQATVLLGKGAITQIAVGVAALHMETAIPTDLPLSRQSFWRHSMGTAFLARQLGQSASEVDSEEAFTAGLLHDIGKLVLMGYLGVEYSSVLDQATSEKKPLHRIEREMLGVDHDDIGRELCNRWKLSSSFQAALSVHQEDEASALKRIVQVANAAAKAAHVGQSGNPYVALDALPYREMRHIAQNWEFVRDVPGEVVKIEQAFRLGPGDAEDSAVDVPSAGQGTVLVQVADEKLTALLMTVLAGLGYRPQEVAPGTSGEAVQADPPVVGGLTDEASLQDEELTWLDVAAWRVHRPAAAGEDAVHVGDLRAWIEQNLEPASSIKEA